jgi:hypothetical protein
MLTERDARLLAVVGEQYALTAAQLARLLGHRDASAAYLRDRWVRAGWVRCARLTYTLPSLVWLTADGAAICASPYRPWRPKVALATHIEAVGNVRLLLAHELGLGDWRCERALRHAAPSRVARQHLPDALLDLGNDRVAVEVELTAKRRARTAAIMQELALGHDQVWYFASRQTRRQLDQLAAESPWVNVSVYPYPVGAADLLA